jgi:uncharacterized protein
MNRNNFVQSEPNTTNSNDATVDCHTHVFCWGEKPEDGFLSRKTQNSILSRFLLQYTGIAREKGNNISEKIRNRLLKDFKNSSLSHIVLLAQDAVYRDDGQPDHGRTHFYVSNDYVLNLSRENPGIIPCCSINPLRSDALQELERCHAEGSRIIKIHTAIQGADPSDPRFEPFYKLTTELGSVLIFHTGYEHACTVISQKFTNPNRLKRPLEHGITLIAAHCGSCGFWDAEDYFPDFIDMMSQYENLYGDTAVMGSMARLGALKRLSKLSDSIKSRILHGSDYPFPSTRFASANPITFPLKSHISPLQMDLEVKRTHGFSAGYENRILDLLKTTPSLVGLVS